MIGVRSLWATAAVTAGLLIAPGAASACRFLTTPLPAGGEFQAMVIAEIDVARDTGRDNVWLWEIDAHVTEVLAGQPAAGAYGFRYITGTNGCDPAPPTGRFVLYIAHTAQGERVVASLPLEEAAAVDPRVKAALSGR